MYIVSSLLILKCLSLLCMIFLLYTVTHLISLFTFFLNTTVTYQHLSIGPADARSDENVLEGALAVQPLTRNLAGFDTYFKSLDPSHNAINPWFEESVTEYCKKQHSGARYRLPAILVSFLVQTPFFSFSYSYLTSLSFSMDPE